MEDTVKILTPYNFTTSKIRCNFFFFHFSSCHRLAVLQALLLIKKSQNKTRCAPVSHMHNSMPSDRNIYLPLFNTPPYCPAITCPFTPFLIFNTAHNKGAAQLEMSHSTKKKCIKQLLISFLCFFPSFYTPKCASQWP